MDIKDLIKSVIQENIVESKKIASDLLMEKLSTRLQEKFEEYAPQTFLDEKKEEKELDPVGKEDEDVDNDGDSDETDEYLKNRRAAVANAMEEDEEEEGDEDEEDEDEDEDEEDEDEDEDEDEKEKGEDGLVYEDGEENDASEMNAKAFGNTGLSEETEQLDEVSPPGMKKMTHSEKARKSFKERYGKKGKSVQYATAWKESKKKKD